MKKRIIFVFALLTLLFIVAGVTYAQQRKCFNCAGLGTELCRPCNGTGKITTGYNETTMKQTYETCSTCKGVGRISPCKFCKGTGYR